MVVSMDGSRRSLTESDYEKGVNVTALDVI